MLHPPPPRSENPCLCGSVPPWLEGAVWMAGSAYNTSLGMPCMDAPLFCSPVMPPEWYSDNAPLLALKSLLVNSTNGDGGGGSFNTDPLYTWTQYRPACTSVNETGGCVPCDWSQRYCGVPRDLDGALTCNYRFISCRGRRVVGLHLSRTVRALLVLFLQGAACRRACLPTSQPRPRLATNQHHAPHLHSRISPSRTSPAGSPT